jgi:phosphate transport system permease protein
MRLGEALIQGFLFASGAISIFTTLGIVFVLAEESWLFFGSDEVSLAEFFTGTTWQPAIKEFGIWPLVNATLMTSVIAMLVALPLGLFAAMYLSEYASPRTRGLFKPILEVLAGIPTVVYGYFALTFMTPLLRTIFGSGVVEIYNTMRCLVRCVRLRMAWARPSWKRHSKSLCRRRCRALLLPSSLVSRGRSAKR